MSALAKDSVFVTRFLRKLRGGSQPILVEASDGFTYVVKFSNNPQGQNVLFNEAMGTELYRSVDLPVPVWRQLNITEEFLNQTPRCWIESAEGFVKPDAGVCFGSRYLGRQGVRLWEILPGSAFQRVENKDDFHLAWILDICASHTDNRQAVFEDHLDGIYAVFVDHGHLFSGADGLVRRPKPSASAYLDLRIYDRNQDHHGVDIAKVVLNINVDKLWRRAQQLPIEWLTDTALRNFAECLGVLSDRKAVQGIVELTAGFPDKKDQREFHPNEPLRGCPDWLLRAGVQGA